MPSEFCKENEIDEKYAIQNIVISMSGFFLSGGEIVGVESAALAALKEAVEVELETRRGAIH